MAKTISVKGNRDTGSVKLDGSVKVGDRIQVAGEEKPRIVTFIMADKLHVCTGDARAYGGSKKQGAFPTGDLEVTVLDAAEEKPVDPVQQSIDQINAAHAAVGKALLSAEEEAEFRASLQPPKVEAPAVTPELPAQA